MASLEGSVAFELETTLVVQKGTTFYQFFWGKAFEHNLKTTIE